MNKQRFYKAEITSRMKELNGAPLATYARRVCAFILDCFFALVLVLLVLFVVGTVIWFIKTGGKFTTYTIQIGEGMWKDIIRTLVPLLYFGLSHYVWDGYTFGKKLLKIRVVSLVNNNITLLTSLKRALGYVSAVIEIIFEIIDIKTDTNRRMAQDRVADTIVIKVNKSNRK